MCLFFFFFYCFYFVFCVLVVGHILQQEQLFYIGTTPTAAGSIGPSAVVKLNLIDAVVEPAQYEQQYGGLLLFFFF